LVINEQSIREACNRLADVLVQKNHDYGNSVEEQFRDYGDTSINLRLEDKLRRLKNLSKKSAQVNEKKSETVLDAAGYSLLAYILYDYQEVDEPSGGPIKTRKGLTYTAVNNLDNYKPPYFDQDDQY
jgi:hypothetical protein